MRSEFKMCPLFYKRGAHLLLNPTTIGGSIHPPTPHQQRNYMHNKISIHIPPPLPPCLAIKRSQRIVDKVGWTTHVCGVCGFFWHISSIIDAWAPQLRHSSKWDHCSCFSMMFPDQKKGKGAGWQDWLIGLSLLPVASRGYCRPAYPPC